MTTARTNFFTIKAAKKKMKKLCGLSLLGGENKKATLIYLDGPLVRKNSF
jgi:hypothetical protein